MKQMHVNFCLAFDSSSLPLQSLFVLSTRKSRVITFKWAVHVGTAMGGARGARPHQNTVQQLTRELLLGQIECSPHFFVPFFFY